MQQQLITNMMAVILFYGSKDPLYGPFSNFYPAEFIDSNGIKFKSTEQYFSYRKALYFEDDVIAKQILATSVALRAKQLGRKVQNFVPWKWANVRKQIMTDGLVLKFSQNPPLRRLLMDTETSTLAEASPRDKTWGIGLSSKHSDATNPAAWKGQNLLGQALMDVRAKLVDN